MLNKDKVRMVHLISGEDVIGEVIGDVGETKTKQTLLLSGHETYEELNQITAPALSEGSVTLRNPHMIVPRQNERGQVTVVLMPWPMYREPDKKNESQITIRGTAIGTVCEVDVRLAKQLEEQTSPIVMPDKGLILPS